MSFLHPYSRYGLALVLQQEGLDTLEEIDAKILKKYLEEGLSNFRLKTDDDPNVDIELRYLTIPMETIINNKIKGNPNKGIYLCPNIITTDIKAHNTWTPVLNLLKKLDNPLDLFSKPEKMTMGIAPIAGELNNGNKTKKNTQGVVIEAICSAITTTTPMKPYLSYRENRGV